MENKQTEELIRIFQTSRHEPETGLNQKIWQNIVLRNKRIAKIKLWIFSSVTLFSLLGLIPVFKTLLSDLTKSGFYEYLSLVFSSNGTFVSYWKELAFSIVESLPLISIISSLSLIFILFLSIKYLMEQIYKNQLLTNVSTLSI